jgi:hypothetical protein
MSKESKLDVSSVKFWDRQVVCFKGRRTKLSMDALNLLDKKMPNIINQHIRVPIFRDNKI